MEKKIKSITLFKNDYLLDDVQSEELNLKGYKYSETKYDTQGNVLAEIKYSQDDEIMEKVVNRYDENGHLIEEIYYMDENEIAERRSFDRDENSKIFKEYKHYLDESKDTIEYKYDTQGLLIEKVTYDVDGDIERKDTYLYSNAKPIEHKSYDEEGNLVFEKLLTYDDSGQVVESVEWDEERDERIKLVENYDDMGNKKETLRYNDQDQLVEKMTYVADEQGRLAKLIEETLYTNSTTNIEYDEHIGLETQSCRKKPVLKAYY